MADEILGADIGGTFTDFILLRGGKLVAHKVLSSPDDPARSFLRGIAELGLGPRAEVVHGSTVATNAILERKGARTALIATRGFADVIEIGRQDRPGLYDFHPSRPPPLVPADLRFEASERIGAGGEVIRPLEPADVESAAARLEAGGVQSVAISFLFSFLHPEHERLARDAVARAAPRVFVSLSSDVAPEHREYERTSTAVVNAYVTPVVERYLTRLEQGLAGRPLRILQSSGGSISAAAARRAAARTVLSGPAGGVVGAWSIAALAGYRDVITFDAGGTSTDAAVCAGGWRETTEGSIAGSPILLPSIDIHTVGAGGGSIARVDSGGALRVGPESAGASPGPACYGLGGTEPTVTDAHVVLGRISPGEPLGGKVAVDAEAARRAVKGIAGALGSSIEDAARGIIRVADAVMERAVRRVTVERGHDPRRFTLVAFGGAGPLHACALAEGLGIARILVPRHPGCLSALGMLLADVTMDFSLGVMRPASSLDDGSAAALFRPLIEEARAAMAAEGRAAGALRLERSMDLRYVGQSYELNVPCGARLRETLRRFHAAHRARHGHGDDALPVEVVTLRVKAVRRARRPPFARARRVARRVVPRRGRARREDLRPGDRIAGPCSIDQLDATTHVAAGWTASVDALSNLVLERRKRGGRA
jgi:N-methylhydantoinase A